MRKLSLFLLIIISIVTVQAASFTGPNGWTGTPGQNVGLISPSFTVNVSGIEATSTTHPLVMQIMRSDFNYIYSTDSFTSGQTNVTKNFDLLTYNTSTNYVCYVQYWPPGQSSASSTCFFFNLTAGVVVQISPLETTISTAEQALFTATVTGSTNTAVTWTCASGSISNGAYTPPSTAGDYSVTATSVIDPTKSATATVHVTAAPVDDPGTTTPDDHSWLTTILEPLLLPIKNALDSLHSVVSGGFTAVQNLITELKTAVNNVVTKITETTNNIVNTLVDGFNTTITSITNKIDAVKSTIVAAIDVATSKLTDLYTLIQNLFQTLFDKIDAFLSTITTAIQSLLDALINALNDLWSTKLSPAFDAIKAAIAAAKAACDNIFSAINDQSEKVQTKIQTETTKVTTKLDDNLNALTNILTVYFNANVKPLLDGINSTINQVREGIVLILNQILTSLDAVGDEVMNAVNAVPGLITTYLESLWVDHIQPSITSVANAAISIPSTIYANVLDLWVTEIKPLMGSIAGIGGEISGFMTNLWSNTIQPLYQSIIDGINSISQNVIDGIGQLFSATGQFFVTFKQALKDVFTESFLPFIVETGQHVSDISQNLYNNVHNAVKNATEGLANNLGTVTGFVTDKFDDLTSGITDIYDATKGFIVALLTNMHTVFLKLVEIVTDIPRFFLNLLSSLFVPSQEKVDELTGKWSELTHWRGIQFITDLKIALENAVPEQLPSLTANLGVLGTIDINMNWLLDNDPFRLLRAVMGGVIYIAFGFFVVKLLTPRFNI